MFRELAETVHLVRADRGREWPRVLGYNERVGAGREGGVFGVVEDHTNVSVVTSTVCGRYSSKHCSEFPGKLVHVFVGRLAVDLGDVEFLEAVFNVLFDSHGGWKVCLLRRKN